MSATASTWEERVAELWRTAADRSDEEVLAAVTALTAERPTDDAASAFERASALDYVGREHEAEALYRQALAAGLDEQRRPQAVIQLASTVRNLGRPAEAVTLLQEEADRHNGDEMSDAIAAFLALALLDSGRPEEAVVQSLSALSPHLRHYSRAVAHYAGEILREPR